ncbi:MAG: GNAT family N-acetyltransferase [Acidimicrobiia bacterium]
MGDVAVREARPTDGEALARAWTDGGRYYVQLDPEIFQVPEGEALVRFFTERPRQLGEGRALFVAEVGAEVVGWVSAVIEPPVQHAEFQLQRELGSVRAHVNAVMVQEDHRGRGVGTALMRHVEAWARDQGAVMISLDT